MARMQEPLHGGPWGSLATPNAYLQEYKRKRGPLDGTGAPHQVPAGHLEGRCRATAMQQPFGHTKAGCCWNVLGGRGATAKLLRLGGVLFFLPGARLAVGALCEQFETSGWLVFFAYAPQHRLVPHPRETSPSDSCPSSCPFLLSQLLCVFSIICPVVILARLPTLHTRQPHPSRSPHQATAAVAPLATPPPINHHQHSLAAQQ